MAEKVVKVSLFSLAWPIFFELLLRMTMGNVDTFMLSQYADRAVAAVGVANSWLFVINVLLGVVTIGTTVLIGRRIGAKREAEAKQLTYQAVLVNGGLSLLLSLILVALSPFLLSAINVPAAVRPEAQLYLYIVGGFMWVEAISMTMSAALKSYGFTRTTLRVVMIVQVLHLAGNAFAIFPPFGLESFGVQGVAISTVASRSVGLFLLAFFSWRQFGWSWNGWRTTKITRQSLREILGIGLPSAGEHLSYTLFQMVILSFVTTFGTTAITTKIYVENINMFVYLGALSIAQATEILVSRHRGAEEWQQAYTQALRSLRIGIVMSLVVAVTMFVFSRSLVDIFTDDRDVIELAHWLLMIVIFLEPGRAMNLVIISSLRAVGDTQFPVKVGIAVMWGVGVPLAYSLGVWAMYGLVGIWIALALDEWVRGLLMIRRWKTQLKGKIA